MNNTKILFYLSFISILGLPACQTISSPTPPLSAPLASDPWQIRASSCMVQATNTEVNISTNGQVINNSIELKVHFALPTVRPPSAVLVRQGLHLAVAGSGRSYTLKLPYTSYQAADLLHENEQLQLHFQPLNHTQVWQQTLPTRELLFALANLGAAISQKTPANCP